MVGNKSFIVILDDKYNEMQKESVTVERLNKEIEFFESFIPEFFSKNGEAKGIKTMYEGIRNNISDENTINCTDLNRISSIYNEYMEGMINFINDIKNIDVITESSDLNGYEEKLNNARANSGLFINSLYDGTNVPFTNTILSEAVTNIECLIEFIPQLQTMKNTCNSLYCAIEECTDNDKKKLLDSSAEMLYESVGAYCYSNIRNIINTYYDINDSLFNESSNEDTEVKFSLF